MFWKTYCWSGTGLTSTTDEEQGKLNKIPRIDVLPWFCHWTVTSCHIMSAVVIWSRFLTTVNHKRDRASALWSVTVLLFLWNTRGRRKVLCSGIHLDHAGCWMPPTGVPVSILSFQKTSSFACEMNNWVRATLSLVISVIQGWTLCASLELKIRYSLLFLLEMVQVNELKPVEVAENRRHLHP